MRIWTVSNGRDLGANPKQSRQGSEVGQSTGNRLSFLRDLAATLNITQHFLVPEDLLTDHFGHEGQVALMYPQENAPASEDSRDVRSNDEFGLFLTASPCTHAADLYRIAARFIY